MITTQVVKMSVTANSLSKDYLHPDNHDHTRQTNEPNSKQMSPREISSAYPNNSMPLPKKTKSYYDKKLF